MEKWEKLGHVFCPDKVNEWMYSHAANTIAEHMHDDVFRIYFSCRNRTNNSHIGFIEIDLFNPRKILKVADKPILAPGSVGLFDDSGVSLSCIIEIDNKKYLYYLGWNLGITVPWRNSIGLAIENADGGFTRNSLAPLLDRNDADPYSISYPFILFDEGIYRMWYGSNLNWGSKQEEMAHLIKYAESNDGVNWKREGRIALNFKNEEEYAMSRPFVIKENGIYKMWYSYRGKAYRIGYAESTDALNWIRKDEEAGIDVSEEGWDSETVEYPFIFDHENERYMLYNGNAYGKTGFGLAKLIKK
jgi:predicted GH43/DUF377 family glycosyl hydrolase